MSMASCAPCHRVGPSVELGPNCHGRGGSTSKTKPLLPNTPLHARQLGGHFGRSNGRGRGRCKRLHRKTRNGWASSWVAFEFNSSHFSSTVCSEGMAKRTQQDSGEEKVTAKSRPMMSLITRAPSTLSSSASESPGKKSYGSQSPLSA